MGVPKFYRWISERYPNISRVINDNQIPDFDNFYLDMNGIIHTCSHLNEDSCEVNVTEEEIFRNIFHYIDFLFRMIKPKKVFVMAVDGVAPRAKMNQQRARRFRAGQERIRKLRKIAEKSGQTLEQLTANHFDTNSITPGTQFMANLNEQLKYFIHVKLTTDPLWEGVDVHLSGHLTPGEGEHKIMDYIRYTRAQPGYDVNTRHCLYGLDADLIMLGLVTHEMHFSLLREEVKYGSKKASKILSPEEINWNLFHTSILRNYIDLEFRSMRGKLQFPYVLEGIIDDWILMAYLVGNDFIPHLPHVHINEEALSILWDTYKKVLPTLDGYLNESGELNLTRFEIYLTELAKIDLQRYSNENDSFKHLAKLNGRTKKGVELKKDQDTAEFNFAALDKLTMDEPPPPIIEKQDSIDTTVVPSIESKSSELSSPSDENDSSSNSDTLSDNDDEDNNEKKKNSKIKNEDDIDNLPLIEAEFRLHKNQYYRSKMKIDLTSVQQLQTYVEQYIEALQWILKYYYQGCPSWSWFYPHHYAPYLSDLKNFKDLKIVLEQGTPFKPFEQLLSVLPPTSRSLLPNVLQSLMIDQESPLLHFYPEYFELDQNEKKQDWEAIVLLPFIDETLLLESITKYYPQLNTNEQNRNQALPSLCFRTTSNLHPIGNSLSANLHFPVLKETRALCTEIPVDQYRSDGLYFKHNHFDEKDLIIFPKCPALNVLPYKFAYKSNAVSLFESRSKSTTLVLNLIHRSDSDCITYNEQWNPKGENIMPPFQITNGHALIERYLGKCVFVNWPNFQYGIVCAISDFQHIYTWSNIPGGSYFWFEPINTEENRDYKNYIQTPIYVSAAPFEVSNDHQNKKVARKNYPFNEMQIQMEYTKAFNINRNYENRHGISIGPIPILLYVSPLIGYRTNCLSTSDKCQTTMCFSNQALAYPLQTTLFKLPNYKTDLDQIPKTIHDYLKLNEPVFVRQPPYYSSLGYVQQINKDKNGHYSVSCRMEPSHMINQPDIHKLTSKLNEHQLKYFTAQQIADRLRTLPNVISKITGKINVIGEGKRRRKVIPANVGLSWKFNKPVRQLYDYTKKIDQIWYYSEKTIPIIAEYMEKFPEIIEELKQKPRDDNYFESNIWPTKKPKHELHQVRLWIKSLPTHSIPFTDGAWEVLDTNIIDEIDKSVKSFYTKRAEKNSAEKTKIVSFEPHRLIKASESLGMCDPDIDTEFYLYDRVVNVRLGTGVPLGTRGTVVGIMYGRTNIDTYYEILFDNLPVNSLDAILLDKKQQKCRIKVHSYHLLNYTHSLRIRSINYQQQRSVPSTYVREQHTYESTSTSGQQSSTRIPGKGSESNHTGLKPKSAPALGTKDRPKFIAVQEQTSNTNHPQPLTETPVQSSVSTEHPSLLSPLVENMPDSSVIAATMNVTVSAETPMSTFPSGVGVNPLFARAIRDFQQFQHPSQQTFENTPTIQMQRLDSYTYHQIWNSPPSQDNQPPFTMEGFESVPSYLSEFGQQSPMYMPSLLEQQPFSSLFQSDIQQFNPNYPPQFNTEPSFPPYHFPSTLPYPTSADTLMNISAPPFYPPGQSPTEIQNIPINPHQHSSPPLQTQQTPSPPVTNNPSLQFLPSPVLRNIVKKS